MARKIEIEIVGDARNFQNALGKASGTSDSFGSSLGKLAKYGALAAGAAGIGGLALVLKAGISEFSEAAKVGAQTNAVLESTGKIANVTSKQVGDLANSLMKKSGVDDEAIQSGENMLLTFTKVRNEVGQGNDIFNQATKASLDLSVALGKDLPSSAMLVGKALNDPVKGMTAMTRAGIQFTDEQKKMIKGFVESGNVMAAQKVILGELTTQFGGSAKALGETLPGKINILKQEFSNLAGSMVGALVPAFSKVVSGLGGFVTKLGEAESARAKFQVVMDGIKSAMGGLGDEMASWGPKMAAAVNVAQGAFSGLAGFFQSQLGQVISVSAGTAVAFGVSMTKIIAAWKAMQLALATINPVFAAIVVAVGLVGGAIFDMATQSDGASAALNRLKGNLEKLLGTAREAAAGELALAEAKNRLKSASLGVEQATKTQTAAEASAGKGSLAYRQATVQLEAAQLARKRATNDVEEADKKATAATKTASDTQNLAKQSVTNLQKALVSVTTAGHDYQRTQASGQKVTKELMDIMDRQSAAKYAKEMADLGAKASSTAKTLRAEGEPALAAIAAGVAKAAKANAKFAEETGKIPGAITKVKGPAVTAMNNLATGVAGAAKSGGASVGASFTSGIISGIGQNAAGAIAAAAAVVNQAAAAARAAAQSKSPSKVFAVIGADLVRGLAKGIGDTSSAAMEAFARIIKSLAGAVDVEAWAARASAALERYGAALTTTEQKLAQMSAAQEKAALASALIEARTALSAANAMKAGKEKAAAILAAEQQMRDAQLAITMAALSKQAGLERAHRDKEVTAQQAQIEKIRTIISARVEALNTAFAKMGEGLERAFGAKTQSMMAALGAKFDAQIASVRAWAAELTNAENALAAFDLTAQVQTMSELALATMDAAEAERERQRALASAGDALKKAQAMPTGEDAKQVRELGDAKADLAAAQAANAAKSTEATLKAVREAGQKVADLEKGLTEETLQRAAERSAAIIAAEEALRAANLAITRAGLQAQAAIERQALVDRRAELAKEAADERAERERQAVEKIAALEANRAIQLQNLEETRAQELVALQKSLTQLQNNLAKHPKEYTKTMAAIKKLLAGYGVDMENSGELLGKAFAAGLKSAEAAVEKAATALANAAAKKLKLSSPAKEGPLSTLDRWFKPLGPMLAKQMDPGPLAKAAARMASAASVGSSGRMAGGMALGTAMAGGNGGVGGGWPERIVLQVDGRTLTEVVRKEVQRNMARNR